MASHPVLHHESGAAPASPLPALLDAFFMAALIRDELTAFAGRPAATKA